MSCELHMQYVRERERERERERTIFDVFDNAWLRFFSTESLAFLIHSLVNAGFQQGQELRFEVFRERQRTCHSLMRCLDSGHRRGESWTERAAEASPPLPARVVDILLLKWGSVEDHRQLKGAAPVSSPRVCG